MTRLLPLVIALLVGVAAAFGLFVGPPGERVLGAYTTSLSGRAASQRHNASLCLRKVDGVVVPPGAVFSFNRTVGAWSRDQGYKRAPVSYNGQLIDMWGGGVCQSSTTLYNAALLSGMEMIERHSHRFAPNYVPPGRDAAVAYANVDLKFRNPNPFPVTIRGEVEGDSLTAQIVGRAASRPSVGIVQSVVEVRQPREYVLGAGHRGRVRNPGKTGYQVTTYRLMRDQKQLLSVDSYPAMDRVVEYR